jgi:uncharacterized membrane protein HdeD (DUF308 family)
MSSTPRTTDDRAAAFDLALASTWPVAMFIGVMTTVIGVMVVAWPDGTLKVLSILFGIQLLLFGLFRLISAFSSDAAAPGLVGFIGVIGMMAGVVVIRNPFETVAVLATVLGLVWVVGGSIELISSIADSTMRDRGLVTFGAAITIVAGIVVLAWPGPTITVIAWIAGVYLIAFGLMICYTALRLRRLEP